MLSMSRPTGNVKDGIVPKIDGVAWIDAGILGVSCFWFPGTLAIIKTCRIGKSIDRRSKPRTSPADNSDLPRMASGVRRASKLRTVSREAAIHAAEQF
jgi:hypothetical protein